MSNNPNLVAGDAEGNPLEDTDHLVNGRVPGEGSGLLTETDDGAVTPIDGKPFHTEELSINEGGPANGMEELSRVGQIPEADFDENLIHNYTAPTLPRIVEEFATFTEMTEIPLPESSTVVIQIDTLRADTEGSTISMQFSTDGGNSWLSGTEDYEWVRRQHEPAAVDNSADSDGDSEIQIMENAGASSGRRQNPLSLTLSDPTDSEYAPYVNWSGTTNGAVGVVRGGGWYADTAGVDRVRIYEGNLEPCRRIIGRVLSYPGD